jgi:hypothetical protein
MAKDYRAVECLSCGMSRKAMLQWGDAAMRAKMLGGIRTAQGRRRRRFEDITEDSNWQIKHDGRRYTYYWDEQGRRRAIYRYQWRWRKAHGPIPPGYEVHHRDHDPSNDALDNLSCVSAEMHRHHHAYHTRLNSQTPWWRCSHCGAIFQQACRGKGVPRKFCSQACHYASKKGKPIAHLSK